MSRLKLVRINEDEYQIEGLDRETLSGVAKALKAHWRELRNQGCGGFQFEPFLGLIATRNLERMRIRRSDQSKYGKARVRNPSTREGTWKYLCARKATGDGPK
jgi:hypothetical protein